MKRSLLCRFFSAAAGLLSGLLPISFASAESLQFALLAKRVDHSFFIQAGEGCAEAARAQGDTCLLLGASGPAHFRRQNQALEQALDRKDLDGIALSVTHSQWLAGHALKRVGLTPLITFDSDLAPAERHLRRGYVGIDNLAFGRHLGMLAQQFRPQGGRLCILSGSPQDTNLQERLQGIRQQLSGMRSREAGADRLKREKGWVEPNRCPLYTADNQEKALIQLATLLNTSEIDAIISIGTWPIDKASMYRQQLGPLLAELDKEGRRPAIIMTADAPSEAQLALLDDGLAQAYLGTEGREIGRQSYRMLKRLAQGKPIPEKVLVHSRVHLRKASLDISPAGR